MIIITLNLVRQSISNVIRISSKDPGQSERNESHEKCHFKLLLARCSNCIMNKLGHNYFVKHYED